MKTEKEAEVSGQCGADANFSFLMWKNIYMNGNDPVRWGRWLIQEGSSSQGSRIFKKTLRIRPEHKDGGTRLRQDPFRALTIDGKLPGRGEVVRSCRDATEDQFGAEVSPRTLFERRHTIHLAAALP